MNRNKLRSSLQKAAEFPAVPESSAANAFMAQRKLFWPHCGWPGRRESAVRTRGNALGYRSWRKERIFSRISQRRSKSSGEVSALARIRISTESDLKSVT